MVSKIDQYTVYWKLSANKIFIWQDTCMKQSGVKWEAVLGIVLRCACYVQDPKMVWKSRIEYVSSCIPGRNAVLQHPPPTPRPCLPISLSLSLHT